MTTVESSSSAAESGDTSMGDNSQDYQQQRRRRNILHLLGRGGRKGDEDGDDYKEDDGGGDDDDDDVTRQRVWETFSNSFQHVQTVLDQNRVLIAQVNENHQSKLPDNLSKNVALIREINTNVAKVVSLYSDLSSTFSDIFLHSHSSSDADADAATTNDNISNSDKA
ncbi:protein EARLY FLOWERING 4-like [Magnolia sinica]|uniref:protein EARLY FLOWERING 4-like n=1 Tax=Magnolia sinica TaxID=86752 RepID=UPI00265ABC9E|nr:protein EARLY FLOWERING 4-like [Magnolia sinica]